MFTLIVPKDFTSPEQRLTWTIVANGQTTSIPLRLHPDYVISPFVDVAVKNMPPVLRFEENGASIQGPIALLSAASTRSTSIASPLVTHRVRKRRCEVRERHDGDAGQAAAAGAAGVVEVSRSRPRDVRKRRSRRWRFSRVAASTCPSAERRRRRARFSEPGEYVLHVTAMDYSGEGGGGEVCCWTTAMVKVSVTP